MHRLTDLHRGSFAPGHRLALSADGGRSWSDFLSDVAALRRRLPGEAAEPCALYHRDTYRFAVALFALLADDRRVYLPGDNNRAVVEAMAERSAHLIGEFPAQPCLPVECALAHTAPGEFRLGGEIVVFTSGSSGEPKSLRKSLEQLDAELQTLEAAFGTELEGRCVLGTVSHQHFYGLVFRLLWPLCAGRAFWHRAFADTAALARRSLACAPVYWVSGPGHLHRLDPALPWPSLREAVFPVFSSGGPLDWGAATRLAGELGPAPREIFGSTETGAIATRQRSREDQPWESLPGVRLGPSARGTISVRSPYLPDGAPFETGDTAEFLGEGVFRLGGRVDRIAKLEGKRIALPEIEAALASTPWIREAHCLVSPQRDRRVAALIALSPEGKSLLAESHQAAFYRRLRETLTPLVPVLGLPRRWRIVPFLPRDAQGKLRRVQLEPIFTTRRRPPVLDAQVSGSRAELGIWVDRSCPYFEGHFPAGKVLPGVAQLFWAQLVARELLGLRGEFAGMQQLKFKDIIGPDTRVELSLDWDRESGRLSFRFASSRGEHSQGRLLYRGPE